MLERHTGIVVTALSKHGSGQEKYGLRHYAPYEPTKYIAWARQSNMKLFLGNLQDPSTAPSGDTTGLKVFPSAFWLEPAWRDTKSFTIDWLLGRVRSTDVVLLVHPENVLSSHALMKDFERLLDSTNTRILQ